MATAWTVNAEGEVWTVQPQGGGQLMAPKNTAMQVALGFNGVPWILSTQRSQGAGNLISYYLNSQWITLKNTIGAVQIAGSTNNFCWFVDENNAVWAVDINSTLFRMSPDGFAISVGVSSVGPAWAISTQSYEGGGGNIISWYSEQKGSWEQVPPPAAAIQIAGQYDESAWVMNSDNAIYNVQKDGTSIRMSPDGSALQVGIGPDNMPWMISSQTNNGTGGNVIMYYANGVWNAVPSPASAIWVAGSI